MCERKKGLIGNYFSETSLTTEHIKKLLDVFGPGRQELFVKMGNILVLVSSALFLSKSCYFHAFIPLTPVEKFRCAAVRNKISSHLKN